MQLLFSGKFPGKQSANLLLVHLAAMSTPKEHRSMAYLSCS